MKPLVSFYHEIVRDNAYFLLPAFDQTPWEEPSSKKGLILTYLIALSHTTLA